MNGFQEQTTLQKFAPSVKAHTGIENVRIKLHKNVIDLTGQKFNNWKVIKKGKIKSCRTYWLCKCDCGNVREVWSAALRLNRSKSCGCLGRTVNGIKQHNHGLSHTRVNMCWRGMKTRCYNKNDIGYKNYGGRGIIVFDGWKNDFMAFYNWAMANDYKDNLTIERIDVNGNYEPDNCTWIPKSEQSKNQRSNINVTIDGETHNIAEWSRITGINKYTMWSRFKNGYRDNSLISQYNLNSNNKKINIKVKVTK